MYKLYTRHNYADLCFTTWRANVHNQIRVLFELPLQKRITPNEYMILPCDWRTTNKSLKLKAAIDSQRPPSDLIISSRQCIVNFSNW